MRGGIRKELMSESGGAGREEKKTTPIQYTHY